MSLSLKELFEFADQQTSVIFNRSGHIMPMYHAVTKSGEHCLFPPMHHDKEVSTYLMRCLFDELEVECYVFIDEAWCVEVRDPKQLDFVDRVGARNHEDRREIVMLIAETRDGQRMVGHRYILRPEHGKPKLMPLKIMGEGETSGRMVGLLKKESKQ